MKFLIHLIVALVFYQCTNSAREKCESKYEYSRNIFCDPQFIFLVIDPKIPQTFNLPLVVCLSETIRLSNCKNESPILP